MLLERREDNQTYFYCPGCKCNHAVNDGWKVDIESTTLSPSVLVRGGWTRDQRCHSFVRNGSIQFLNDCTHDLAGKTVKMEEGPL